MQAEDIYRCQRLAGQLRRYHTWPVLVTQTNAEHSWQVMRVYIQLFGIPSAKIFHYVQFHDAGEIRWGDLPYPAKSNNPEIKKAFDTMEENTLVDMGVAITILNKEERAQVKIADLFEMWEYGMQEMAMGNKLARPIVTRTADNISKNANDLDPTGHLLTRILTIMGEFKCTME